MTGQQFQKVLGCNSFYLCKIIHLKVFMIFATLNVKKLICSCIYMVVDGLFGIFNFVILFHSFFSVFHAYCKECGSPHIFLSECK